MSFLSCLNVLVSDVNVTNKTGKQEETAKKRGKSRNTNVDTVFQRREYANCLLRDEEGRIRSVSMNQYERLTREKGGGGDEKVANKEGNTSDDAKTELSYLIYRSDGN